MWLPETDEGPTATYSNGHPRTWVTQDAATLAAESDMLDRVNGLRASQGLDALAANETLTRAARGHSRHMILHEFFDHTNPEGESPPQRACALGMKGTVGENLALGYVAAGDAFDAWVASPAHYANMTEPSYVEAGAGYQEWRWTLELRAP